MGGKHYVFDENRSKQEAYAKNEVYSKDEVYNKNEVYSKDETDSKIKYPFDFYITDQKIGRMPSSTELRRYVIPVAFFTKNSSSVYWENSWCLNLEELSSAERNFITQIIRNIRAITCYYNIRYDKVSPIQYNKLARGQCEGIVADLSNDSSQSSPNANIYLTGGVPNLDENQCLLTGMLVLEYSV